jgi:hypothetical protein
MTKPSSKLTGKPLGMPTCQFCGEHSTLPGPGGQFVQYGIRHYAHQICYLLAGKSVADLTPKQHNTFTMDVVQELVRRILRLDKRGGDDA